MTIKFLNPTKLGETSESWLRQEAFGSECTAATCLYFFLMIGFGRLPKCGFVEPLPEWTSFESRRLMGVIVRESRPVVVAVSNTLAIVGLMELKELCEYLVS